MDKRLDVAEGTRLIHAAVERGVTFFDTAEVYGPWINEELVGQALAPVRDKVVIATKFGFNIDQASGKQGPASTAGPSISARWSKASLQRLGDRDDRPALPAPGRPGGADRGGGRSCQRADRGGQGAAFRPVRGAARTIRRAHAVHPVAALQSEYSLWWREPEAEVLPTLAELGIGFVPYSPLGRGFLTGTITATSDLAADDFRNNLPALSGGKPQGQSAPRRADQGDRREQGGDSGPGRASLASGAGPSIVPIPGTTRIGRLDENLSSLELDLDADDLRAIDAALADIEIVGERYPPVLAAAVKP